MGVEGEHRRVPGEQTEALVQRRKGQIFVSYPPLIDRASHCRHLC